MTMDTTEIIETISTAKMAFPDSKIYIVFQLNIHERNYVLMSLLMH